MKEFPEIYKKDVTEKMYAELNINSDVLDLLKKYIHAVGNLYGIIEVSKVYEIIDSQNPGVVTKDDFIAFTEVIRHEADYIEILSMDELFEDGEESAPFDRLLVMDWIDQFEGDFEYIYERQQGVEYYVPEKELLLKYANDFFFESNVYTEKMLGYLKNGMGFSLPEAKDQLIDVICMIKVSKGEIKPTLGFFINNDRFSDEQWDRFEKLYAKLADNIRLNENRGRTNAELGRHYVSLTKVGKNDPCPCGSGKKYKKCCGLK